MKFLNFDNRHFDRYLGEKLKDCRRRQKLTLVDIAKLLGISFQQLQKYETALSRVPASLLYKLSVVYAVSLDALFNEYTKRYSGCYPGFLLGSAKPSANILVVEDNPDDEKITQRALEGIDDLNIMFVHDCSQAMRLMKHNSDFEEFKIPDLIFLDYYMPKRDGLSMLRELKADYRFLCVPIIMLTNNINAKAMTDAYRYGASGYICKSFDFSKFKKDIVNSVNYWIKTIVPPSRIFEGNEEAVGNNKV